MSYVILVRNPSSGSILAVRDDDEKIAVYETEEEAEHAASETFLCQHWPYAIVEAP